MLIERKSPLTGKVRKREIPITVDQLVDWHRGAHIQVVAPHLSDDEREFIKTGISADEWSELWSKA